MTGTVLSSAPPSDGGGGGSPRNRVLIGVGAAVAIALVAALIWFVSGLGGGEPASTTVDRSRDPNGIAAMVLLLEAFGATVEVDDVARLHDRSLEPADVALVVPGVALDETDRWQLSTWADQGGRVVDATGGEVVGSARSTGSPRPVTLSGACPLRFLDDVETVLVAGNDALLGTEWGSTACFSPPGASGGSGFLVHSRVGSGSIVRLGGLSQFTNALLDQADNSVLATSLLAPEPGTRVVMVRGTEGMPRTGSATRRSGSGSGEGVEGDRIEQERAETDRPEEEDPGLVDLLPEGVRWGLVQLLVALVLYVLWRGRRVGAPVAEPSPVDIDGSQLVSAVGNLLARTGSHEHAGELLRADAVRTLTRRLGIPASTPRGEVAAATAARFGLEEMTCRSVLDGPPTTDDESLVALAAELDDLREEIRDGLPA